MGLRRAARGAWVVVAALGLASCGGDLGSNLGTGAGGAGAGGAGAGGSGIGEGGSAAGGGATGGTGAVTACGAARPCGGTPVVGTWQFTTECVNLLSYTRMMQEEIDCVQVVVTAVDVSNLASNFTFSGELTYSLVQNITASVTFNMPVSCTGGLSCADWATARSLTAGGAFACDGTSTCACQQTASDSFTDTGTYTLSGTNIDLASTISGTTTVVPYCLQGGSTMHFLALDTSIQTGGGPLIGKDIVAEKE